MSDIVLPTRNGVERFDTIVGAPHLVSLIDKNKTPRSEGFGLVVDEQN
jgi:hypothetical protein